MARRGSSFAQIERGIARSLEGTKGPKKYAGDDNRFSENEAEKSAKAIAASIGRRKLGKKEMARRAAAGRRRARMGRR